MTAKPTLANILQRKGAATKPTEVPQRGLAEAPAVKGKAHALTLRLEDPDYERLREFAFRRNLSHQRVMLDALRRYLDSNG